MKFVKLTHVNIMFNLKFGFFHFYLSHRCTVFVHTHYVKSKNIMTLFFVKHLTIVKFEGLYNCELSNLFIT